MIAYTKIEGDSLTITAFLNWDDYARFMNGDTIGTRYSDAKIELTAIGEKYPSISTPWFVKDNVQKLTNDDYCITFPRVESGAFIEASTFTFEDMNKGTKIFFRIYWPTWSHTGYHEAYNKAA